MTEASTTTTKSAFVAFSIRNLADPVIDRKFDEPWLTAPEIHPNFANDRDAYKRWLHDKDSVVPLFSLVEGENRSLRTSAANRPYRIHGVVADYDATLTDAEVTAGLERVPRQYPVFAWNRTRRGGVRCVWQFERPVFYYGPDSFKRLMSRVKKELKLNSLFPELDDKALMDPNQTYAAGSGWTVKADAYIKNQTLWLWLFEVLTRTDDFSGEDVEIPLDRVAAEAERKFPGRWKGDFVEGARGLRFWDAMADNETAAIVRKTGMSCFTGPKAFMRWQDIFGRDFVQAFLEDKRGKAMADLWSDTEKNFYRRLPDETWDLITTEQLRRHLKVQFGLSDKAGEDASSEVDQVIHRIETAKRVDRAVPLPHWRGDIIEIDGRRHLNTSTCRLFPAALDPQDWAVNFPWIADYATGLMIDKQNLDVLLYATAVHLKSCHEGRPCRGHAMFIAGPTGTGKTFWSRRILGRMFGGCTSVTKQFTDPSRNKYNDGCFTRPIWTIDDAITRDDPAQYTNYSNEVKALVANPEFHYAKKWGYEGDCPFTGRLWVTMNLDSLSLTMLPDTGISMLEKVCFLRTSARQIAVASNESERYEVVDRELPYFIRWLLDMPRPSWLEDDKRFGFKAWHDQTLLDEARGYSAHSAVVSAVDAWRRDHEPENPRVREWSGNAAQLLSFLRAHPEAGISVERMSVIGLGRHLSNAVRNDIPWLLDGGRHATDGRRFRILLPDEKNN